MKRELNVKDALNWLDEQELIYASAQGTGGVRIFMHYRPASSDWIVYLGGVLYQGPDLEKAVEAFNQHAYN